jgi:hypothetical protein
VSDYAEHMNRLESFISDHYGDRCSDYEPHCICCLVWQLADDYRNWLATHPTPERGE